MLRDQGIYRRSQLSSLRGSLLTSLTSPLLRSFLEDEKADQESRRAQDARAMRDMLFPAANLTAQQQALTTQIQQAAMEAQRLGDELATAVSTGDQRLQERAQASLVRVQQALRSLMLQPSNLDTSIGRSAIDAALQQTATNFGRELPMAEILSLMGLFRGVRLLDDELTNAEQAQAVQLTPALSSRGNSELRLLSHGPFQLVFVMLHCL